MANYLTTTFQAVMNLTETYPLSPRELLMPSLGKGKGEYTVATEAAPDHMGIAFLQILSANQFGLIGVEQSC